MLKYLVTAIALFTLGGCASQPVLPDSGSIKVGREKPDSDCKEIGKVRGRTGSVKGGAEEALEDLKEEAANKGATYVKVEKYSDNRTAVTGIAYQCN